MVGWGETAAVWPVLAVSGLSFAAMQFYWSNYQESGLVDVVSALFALVVTALFLKVWRPRTLLPVRALEGSSAAALPGHSPAAIVKGWSPFLLASIFIFLWGMPAVSRHLTRAALKPPMPALHRAVLKMPPVVPLPAPEDAVADFNLAATPGTAVFLAAVTSALLMGMPPSGVARVFGRTCLHLAPSMLAIICMVSLAFVTRYSGMDTVLGLCLTRTGWAYAFFGTLLGWLGVALTGTDAGSNALFGNLQKVTAKQLGLDPVLMAAANSAGGVMGKMIDAQSIVIASTATEQEGRESQIFQAVLAHSLALVCVVGAIVMLYAFAFPAAVPPLTWPNR
jgi:lactate permease